MKPLTDRVMKSFLLILACGVVPACGNYSSPGGATAEAPSFGGLTSATPLAGATGSVALTWTPAISLTGGAVSYNVFYAIGALPDNSGSEAFQFNTPNATGITVTGLVPKDPYIFIVQAQDSTGATDGNTVEFAATAP
jgi:hypothetical protein